MTRYLVARFAQASLTLLGVSVIVFAASRLSGDPAAAMLASGGLGNNVDPSQLAALRKSLGLDAPIAAQYWRFLVGALHGDLGYSFWQKQPVTELLAQRLPASAQLAGTSALLGLLLGMPAGILAARRIGRAADSGIMAISAIGLALPVFWLGPMLILLFAVTWGVLPAFGYGGPANVILPAITLAIPIASRVSRIARSETADIYSSDYMQTARAKGLLPRQALLGHALKGIFAPVIPLYALELGALIGAAVITETIFAWPGVGRLIIEAVDRRDFPLIQGGALFLGAVYVVLNLIADLAGRLVDPQIPLTNRARA